MNQEILTKTVARLLASPKGLLAIDESLKTCNARFEKLGVPTTVEKRREYRELLITAPEIENYISGYILFDETIRQSTLDGTSFTDILKSKGIDIGIKVDKGTIELPEHPGDKITEGLEGLNERLKEYKSMGATFAKWRAEYFIGEITPSEECMKINAEIFTQYAILCQENGIVPIVEPEILINGNHTMEKCYEVTARNLEVIFAELTAQRVFLPGIILKTSMIIPGQDAHIAVHNMDIARMTIKCLKEKVPEAIGGIVFLSGGETDEDATKNLNDMHKLGPLPWPLTFSYGRAIQHLALSSWAKDPENVSLAQELLVTAAEHNSLASMGAYEE